MTFNLPINAVNRLHSAPFDFREKLGDIFISGERKSMLRRFPGLRSLPAVGLTFTVNRITLIALSVAARAAVSAVEVEQRQTECGASMT